MARQLEQNANTTMPTIGEVRRVRVPAGTRTLFVSSEAEFGWETPAVEKADGDAITAGRSLQLPAGVHKIRLARYPEGRDAPGVQLPADTFFYFHPTAADQPISFRATKVG